MLSLREIISIYILLTFIMKLFRIFSIFYVNKFDFKIYLSHFLPI
jgi:hypothetical protein